MSVKELKDRWAGNRRELHNLIDHNRDAQWAICRMLDDEYWRLTPTEVAAAFTELLKQIEDLQIRNAHLAFPHIAAEMTESEGMRRSRVWSSTVSMTESAVRNVHVNVLGRDLRQRLDQQFHTIMEAVAKYQADAKQESGEEP